MSSFAKRSLVSRKAEMTIAELISRPLTEIPNLWAVLIAGRTEKDANRLGSELISRAGQMFDAEITDPERYQLSLFQAKQFRRLLLLIMDLLSVQLRTSNAHWNHLLRTIPTLFQFATTAKDGPGAVILDCLEQVLRKCPCDPQSLYFWELVFRNYRPNVQEQVDQMVARMTRDTIASVHVGPGCAKILLTREDLSEREGLEYLVWNTLPIRIDDMFLYLRRGIWFSKTELDVIQPRNPKTTAFPITDDTIYSVCDWTGKPLAQTRLPDWITQAIATFQERH